MTYHQLRTFLAVARTGSLTKAARQLNASQPAVSVQLRALQRFLGTPLIERVDRGFRLTPAGEQLRQYADEVLGGLRALRQDIAALEGRLAGPIAVGATFVVSGYVLPSALFRFREGYPEIDLQLHVELPESLFGGLRANALDVACYIDVRTPAGLTVESLGEEELVVVASPRHELAGRRGIDAGELSEHPFVAPASILLREELDAKLGTVGIKPKIAAEALHLDAVKTLVARGAGYSVLIRAAVAQELASGRLVALEIDAPPVFSQIVVAYRSRPAPSALVHEFIRFVRAHVGDKRPAASGVTPERADRAR